MIKKVLSYFLVLFFCFNVQCFAQGNDYLLSNQLRVYHDSQNNYSLCIPRSFTIAGKQNPDKFFVKDNKGNCLYISVKKIPDNVNINVDSVLSGYAQMCENQAIENGGKYRYAYIINIPPYSKACICSNNERLDDGFHEYCSSIFITSGKIFNLIYDVSFDYFKGNEKLLQLSLASFIDENYSNYQMTDEQQITQNKLR